MQNHWSTFITLQDLQTVASVDINAARIPIGYWMFDWVQSEGFVNGSEPYLTQLVRNLKKANMTAILDLHAFPGGAANGQSFNGLNTNGVHAFEPANLARGTKVLQLMAEYIANLERSSDTSGVITAIEPMNEPDYTYSNQARSFYQTIVPILRQNLSENNYSITLSLMDDPGTDCSWLLAQHGSNWANVYYHHLYHAYGDDTPTATENYCKTCCRDPAFLKPCWSTNTPMIIGEWSCTTNTADSQELKDSQFLSTYFTLQTSAYDTYPASNGFFFWTLKLGPDSSESNYYINFSLENMINSGISIVIPTNNTMCPGENLSNCPTFVNPQWNSPCTWN